MPEFLLQGRRAIEFLLNETRIEVATVEQLGQVLDQVDAEPMFELHVTVPDGPIVSMLRNGRDAWLMYLREPGDNGFRSEGTATRQGTARFTLSNGQVDEYPLAWCIDVEQCYKVVAYFCVNVGARPAWVDWIEN